MHRVNKKKKKILVLRFFTYALTLVLTIVTTVLLLYLALGYRLGSSGHVVRNGLLLVDNRPQSAQVFINSKLKDTRAPSRFVLPAGSYEVLLSLDGYRDWSKQVKVSASKVRDVNYPLLIPADIQRRELNKIEQSDIISQSPDRKQLVAYSANSAIFTVINLDIDNTQFSQLNLVNVLKNQSGKVGSLEVIEWSLDNKHFLIEQTLPNGEQNIISVNIAKPEESINISSVIGDQTPTNIHYAGDNTDQIYGIKNSVLSKYNIKDGSSVVLMQNVVHYEPYGNDTVLFAKILEDQSMQVGILKDQKTTIIESSPSITGKVILKYVNYDSHNYFVVAFSDTNQIVVYRDPLSVPILSKQLPFLKLTLPNTQKIDFSGSGEFMMAQNGSDIMVYNFDDLESYVFKLDFDLASNQFVTWVDDHHLQAINTSNESYIYDFDGTNKQNIINVKNGSKVYYSNNFQHIYNLQETDGSVTLGVASLVVGKR